MLPEGPVSTIARRFEIATEGVSYLIPPLSGLLGGGDRSTGGPRANNHNNQARSFAPFARP